MQSLPPLAHATLVGDALASGFDRSDCGVCVSDDEGHVIAANRPFANLFGYTLDELRALSVKDLSGREDFTQTEQVYRRLMRGEQVFDLALLRRKDGSVGNIRYRAMNATLAERIPVLVSVTHEISSFVPVAA